MRQQSHAWNSCSKKNARTQTSSEKVAAILRSDVHLDLLITDVGLPNGMNGRQVAEAAREIRPGLKVLFVTGYAESTVLSHGHLDEGMQVVTKPFDVAKLAARIQAMMSRSGAGGQPDNRLQQRCVA